MIWFCLLLLPVLCSAAPTEDADYSTDERGVMAAAAAAEAAAATPCEAEEGCPVADDCDAKCGCQRGYFYNETTGDCLLSAEAKASMVEKYDNEEKIRLEADSVFRGVIASGILFVTCSMVLVLSACIYCIRMNYTDRKLKSDVQALAQKRGRQLPRAPPARPAPRYPPVADSCTVLVEDAGICVM